MKTECKTSQLKLHALYSRDIIAKFDGGNITSDSGTFILREVEKRMHILKRLSDCFTDYRNPKRVEHTVEALIKQRVFGIAMGYEDLNDHDSLRQDPFLGLLCEKQDPTGSDRFMERDKGKASAGKSTLNRLELGAVSTSRYKKIVPNMEAIDDLLVDLFIESYAGAPAEIVLDSDRTSTYAMRSNQLRLYFSSFAYVIIETFRRLALAGTEMAKAQCHTIRLKLFKIGAQIRVTVRKVWLSLSESFPFAGLLSRALAHLHRIPLRL
jgi:hypothetical protein